MGNNISLSQSVLQNLLLLDKTSAAFDDVSAHVNARARVLGPVDDPVAFFAAQGYRNVVEDYGLVKSGLDKSLSVISEGLNAVEKGIDTINQMKALADSAKASSDDTERKSLSATFKELRLQLDKLLADATMGGVNLVKATPDNMTINLDPAGTNTYVLSGIDLSVGVIGLTDSTTNDWKKANDADVDTAMSEVKTALSKFRSASRTLGDHSKFLTTRVNFTKEKMSNHNQAATALTALTQAELAAALAQQNSLAVGQQAGAGVLAKIAENEKVLFSMLGR